MQCNSDSVSPESQIVPTIDMGQAQMGISGETFPGLVLELCDNCHWCLTCFNIRGLISRCPLCERTPSLLPMNIDEVCLIERDERRGLSICFDRKPPLR